MNNLENFSPELILAKMQKLQTRVEQLQQEKAELKQENEEQQNQISKILSEKQEIISMLRKLQEENQKMIEENKRKRFEVQQLTMNSAEEKKNKEKLQNELRKKNELQEQNELIQKQEKNDLRDKVDNLQRQLNQAGDIIKEERKQRHEAEGQNISWKFMFWTAVAAAVICFLIAFHIVGFWQPFIQFCIGIVVLLFVLYVIDKIQNNPIMSSFIAGCAGLIGLLVWLILR